MKRKVSLGAGVVGVLVVAGVGVWLAVPREPALSHAVREARSSSGVSDAEGGRASRAPQPSASALAEQRERARRRALDRARADAIRERAAERKAAQLAAEQQAARQAEAARSASPSHTFRLPAAPGSESAVPPAPPPAEEQRRRDYIRAAVQEQYIPVARDCYQELLERQPTASGRVDLSFAIVGAADAGVVDRVELGDETTMDDPEFTLCMRESMYATIFEPPPPGASETTVRYPLVLEPGEPDERAPQQQ